MRMTFVEDINDTLLAFNGCVVESIIVRMLLSGLASHILRSSMHGTSIVVEKPSLGNTAEHDKDAAAEFILRPE